MNASSPPPSTGVRMTGKKKNDRRRPPERSKRISSKCILFLLACLCAGATLLWIYWNTKIVVFMKSPTDENVLVLGLVLPRAETITHAAESMTAAITESQVGTARDIAAVDNKSSGEDTAFTEKGLTPCGNSQKWLEGPRHGNLRDDPLLTDDLAKSLILNLKNLLVSEQRHAILGQTICHADGRFRNDTAAGMDFDDRTVRLWAVRLIYLAMHYHQHRLAVPEATQRYAEGSSGSSHCSPAAMLEKYNVGSFDFECPAAKFVILSLGGNWLGANVRGGMVPALLMGLASDRVVLFINNSDRGVNEYLTKPWPLASCPRKDSQCFFFPTSPCTLAVDDIANAYQLDRRQVLRVNKLSMRVPNAERHKVWAYNSQFLPNEDFSWRAVAKLHEYARIMVDAVPNTQGNAHFIALLNKAADEIKRVDEHRNGTYNFASRWVKIYHALTIYSTRPNPSSALELEKIMEEIIPANFDPETSFGLPIRGMLLNYWMDFLKAPTHLC